MVWHLKWRFIRMQRRWRAWSNAADVASYMYASATTIIAAITVCETATNRLICANLLQKVVQPHGNHLRAYIHTHTYVCIYIDLLLCVYVNTLLQRARKRKQITFYYCCKSCYIGWLLEKRYLLQVIHWCGMWKAFSECCCKQVVFKKISPATISCCSINQIWGENVSSGNKIACGMYAVKQHVAYFKAFIMFFLFFINKCFSFYLID